MVKRKTKLYALTYHPRKDKWSAKVVTKKPKRMQRGTSLVRGTSAENAWRKLSMKSYRGETKK